MIAISKMNSKNNFTPNQLSFAAALFISITVGLVFLLSNQNWKLAIVIFLFFFIFSFSLISYILKNYIKKQIKLIYKIISQTKATKKEDFYLRNLLPEKSIDDVRNDVEKWAEQRKNEIEVLQQNEAFRKEFLQNLSHELKTPIFSIQGYVETLLNGALSNPEVNIKFLTNTSKNIDRLANLVDDLDEISKLERGELKFQFQTFVIQDLIKEIFETLAFKASEKNVTCHIKKGCELPFTVYADKEKIRQVLTNITDNAIKYGKQNGTVEASFYKVEGKNILIEISDDGAGILEEHRLRIFERFFRTDEARSRKIGGSGLGLAICKHIIEAHHQQIHVRSKIDVGTTFGFQLPSGK